MSFHSFFKMEPMEFSNFIISNFMSLVKLVIKTAGQPHGRPYGNTAFDWFAAAWYEGVDKLNLNSIVTILINLGPLLYRSSSRVLLMISKAFIRFMQR